MVRRVELLSVGTLLSESLPSPEVFDREIEVLGSR